MKLKSIIGHKKAIVDWGAWKGGKMPRSAFPLSKSGKSLMFRNYEWRIVKFTISDTSYRVLVAFNYAKEQYYAVLGQEIGTDSRILASYEFHGIHPGWHVHGMCDEVEDVPLGRFAGSWKRRVPSGRGYHRSNVFNVTKTNALNKAVEFYRLDLEESDQKRLL